MRILIATSYRSLIGGVERYLQIVIPGLLNRGHEIGLLYEISLPGASEVIDTPGAVAATWCWSESSPSETLASIAQWRPEMVYSQGLEDGALEGSLLDTYPVVLYAHNYFGTCVSGRKCHSFPSIRPCARRFGPGCLALYYPRRCGGLNPSTMLKMYARQTQIHSRLPQYAKVLVASTHMASEFENHGVRPDQIQVAPLPAAAGAPQDRAPTRSPQGRVLFLGRLTDIKGCIYLVKALALAGRRGHALTLTIAGDGPERARVQHLAENLGVPLRCAGWVGAAEKLELVREADLLAIPSLWPEPFGMVGVEAGCQGVPAVGYAAGGIPDWLIPGVSGELAPANPPTPEGLAEAIVRAVADPDHYRRLCQGAWEMSRNFSLQRHLEHLDPIFAEPPSGVSREAVSYPCARI